MSVVLSYEVLAEFKRHLYKDCLTAEHLLGQQKYFKKLIFPDGGVDETANLWGYVLQKDNTSFILSASYPTSDGSYKELQLFDTLPILTKNKEKVAVGDGTVYWWIKKPVSAKIKPERHLSLKQILAFLTQTSHSNKKHQRLYYAMLLAQLLGKANFAVSTEAGFGKDSGVDTLGHLIGNCATIENPTVAKLEFLAKTSKILAFNEVVTTTAMKVDEINQFLLAVAAHKPTLTKRSRRSDDVSEYIDIGKLSILLLYNDIDHYKFGTPFFDEVAPAAVLDRFPRLRLTGRFTHVFENLATQDITEVVKANYDMLHNVVRSLYWYKQSYISEYHGYDTTKLISMPYRWQINTQVLFTIIDVLCDTQAEFDEYIHTFNGAVLDYQDQLQFPHKAKTFLTSLGLSEKQVELFKSFRAVEAYFRAHKRTADADLVAQINQAKLFRDKYALMESHGKHTTTENGLESFI